MKAFVSILLVKPALRTSTFAALILGLVMVASANAQDLTYVKNLAPDSLNVSPAEFNAAVESLALDAATQRFSRAPLNLTGDGATSSFLVLSSANVAGLNGAFYKTELSILPNWTSSIIKVNMYAIPNNTNPFANPSAIHGGSFTLHGFTVYTWDNILASLGLSGAGYVVVSVDSSVYNSTAYAMSVWANTYTAAPAGGYFRTPVPVFTDASLFGIDSYRHPNVTQNDANRNNIVVYNVSTTMSLTVDIRFHVYQTEYPDLNALWTTFTATLAPGESRQYSFASIFPGVTGRGELAFNYKSGGYWAGYVIRTDNGTNDGLLELPYKWNYSSWPY